MSSYEKSLDERIGDIVLDAIHAFHQEDHDHHGVNVEPGSNIAELGIDPMELVMEVEEQCNDLDEVRRSDVHQFSIPDERMARVRTVAELIEQTYDAVVDVIGNGP
jgi:hypothetical protein